MGKRLDGSSLFSGINAGLANSFALLSSQYSDGLTLENLNKALTNTNVTNTTYGSTFASYLTTNFNSVDKNADGTISADEIQMLRSEEEIYSPPFLLLLKRRQKAVKKPLRL